MKATEKIKLMMRLEKGFQKLDLEELHMIRDTLNKEIKKREEEKNNNIMKGDL